MSEKEGFSRLTVSMPFETRQRLQAIAKAIDIPESAIVKIALHRTFRSYEKIEEAKKNALS